MLLRDDIAEIITDAILNCPGPHPDFRDEFDWAAHVGEYAARRIVELNDEERS